ncbi:putative ribonuclease H-like domain-containing protein [Tanacetum coccineum]
MEEGGQWSMSPPGFEDPNFPVRVYNVEKAMYGLHQALRAWYETLSTYLLDNEFQRGKIDKTLFIKRYKGDILLVQVYMDDIIFGSTKKELCNAFEKFTEVKTASTPIETQKPLLKDEDGEEVDVHMYRSMIGSLMYLTSSRPDIMFAVCACARYQVNPKVSHLHDVKRIFRYLKGQPKLGLWYPKDSPFDLVAYTDSDYARASLDRKSTTGGCQFLGCRLISWQCKKQTVVALIPTQKAGINLLLLVKVNAARDGENLDKMKEKGDPCILVGYSTQSKGYRVYNKRTRLIVESIHLRFNEIKEMSETSVANDTSGLIPQQQKASDYDNSGPDPQLQNVSPSADTIVPSQQELDLLFDTLPSTNIHSTSEPSTPTHVNAEENNNDQAEFTNPFCIPVQEVAESSSRNIVEPKNIKEGMADSAWIEAMQEELHQFDRLQVWELVDKPFGKNVITLKWLWKNKKDKDQTVIRNKARLVAKAYAQEEESSTWIKASSESLFPPTDLIANDWHGIAFLLYHVSPPEWCHVACGPHATSAGGYHVGQHGSATLADWVPFVTVAATSAADVAEGILPTCNFELGTLGLESYGKPSDAIDVDAEITLVSVHDVNVSAGEEVFATTIDDITLSQDKGKGILIEPVKPMNKKDLIRLDEEIALNLQAEFDEDERLAREKAKKEEEANIALIETWDDIQAKIGVDHQLAKIMQA